MKFMVTWTVEAANLEAAQRRFIEQDGHYAEAKLLGQWYATNGVSGWSLVESEDATALDSWISFWADLLNISMIAPVVEGQEVAAFLASKVKRVS